MVISSWYYVLPERDTHRLLVLPQKFLYGATCYNYTQ